MKKILIISSSPFISGAEISLTQLLEKIDTKCQLMLITGNVDYFNSIKVVDLVKVDSIIDKILWLQFLSQSLVINYKCFYKVGRFKPDFIYFNTTNSFLNFFWIGILFFKAKKIWHVRDVLKRKGVIKILSFFANVVVCNSIFICNQFKLTSKKRVVYGGIDVDIYKPQKGISQGTRKKLTKIKTVACIAQLTPWKNQIDFIKAAQIIHKKNSDIKFLLIGDILNPKDTIYKKLLIEEIKNHNLNGIIELTGFQKNIVEGLSEIDVLIHPAIEEPFGRVLIEAMSMEVPIVAYKSGGPQEIIVNKETGYLVTPYDYELLATQAVKLLENDDLRLKLGQEGRKRVAKKFSIESYVDGMGKLFKVI